MNKAFSFAISALFCGIVLLTGCENNPSSDRKDGFSETPKNPGDSLFKLVMKGHDVAMSKMGKIKGYRKSLDGKLDSLKKVGSGKHGGIEKKYSDLAQELKAGEDDMNTWMHEFSMDSAQKESNYRINYLQSQERKVNKVRDDILKTLEKADSILLK